MKQSATLRNYAARLRTQADNAAAQPKRHRGGQPGNKNALGHRGPIGRKRPEGAGRKPAAPGDPRKIKINVAINQAESDALDAKAAAAGLSRLDMIRKLILS